MRVRHLIVISVHTFGGFDTSETDQSAEALFRKHGSKSESAILLRSGMYCLKVGDLEHVAADTKVLKQLGRSPVKLDAQKAADDDAKAAGAAKAFKHEIGVYIVFHSDDNEDGGHPFACEMAANFLATILPGALCKGIGKISLIACHSATPFRGGVARQGDLESLQGQNIAAVKQKFVGRLGSPLMLDFMAHLVDNGIRPQICGFDVPIYIGGGAKFEVLDRKDGQWAKQPSPLHPIDQLMNGDGTIKDPLAGAKLVQTRMLGVKARLPHRPDYKNLHKKVMRVDANGVLSFGLVGWSDKE